MIIAWNILFNIGLIYDSVKDALLFFMEKGGATLCDQCVDRSAADSYFDGGFNVGEIFYYVLYDIYATEQDIVAF